MFDKRYEIVLADTEESKKIHFNLRYQVYCLEKGFEEAESFTDKLERDDYDKKAVHFLIRCRNSKRWVGTFRLVIDNFDNLPIHHHSAIYPEHFKNSSRLVSEFSRLAVLRTFQSLPGKPRQDEEHNECAILMRAIYAGVEYSRQEGLNEITFFCRRSLGHIVSKLGFVKQQIGSGSMYRGMRYPYRVELGNFPTRTFDTAEAIQRFHTHNAYRRYSDIYRVHHMAA